MNGLATAASSCGQRGAGRSGAASLTGYGDSLHAATQDRDMHQLVTEDSLRTSHPPAATLVSKQRIMAARGRPTSPAATAVEQQDAADEARLEWSLAADLGVLPTSRDRDRVAHRQALG